MNINRISRVIPFAAWAMAAGWVFNLGWAIGQTEVNPLRPVPAVPTVNTTLAQPPLQEPDPRPSDHPAATPPVDGSSAKRFPTEDPADEGSGRKATTPLAGFLTFDELNRRRISLEAATDVDATVKADLLQRYARAEEWLQTAAESARQITAWNAEIEQAPARIASARQLLEEPLPEIRTRFSPDASVEDLQAILDQHQEQLSAAREELAAREAATGTRERRTELLRLTEETNKQLDEVRKRLAAGPAPEEPPAATLARRSEIEAQLTALDQQLRAMAVENRRLDAVAELLTLERDLIRRHVNHLERAVAAWQEAVSRQRKIVAQAQIREAKQVREQERAWQEIDPTLEELGQRDAELAEKRSDLATKLADITQEVEAKAKQFDDVRRAQRSTVEKVEAAGLSSTIGLMLRDQREQLPDVAHLRSRLLFVEREMPDYRYQEIELIEHRQRIVDPETSVRDIRDRLTHPMSDDAWKSIEPRVREVLTRQRRTVDDLLRDYRTYLDRLSDLEINTRRLLSQVREFADYIDERILWIRSTERLSLRTFSLAREQLKRLAAPAVWIEAAQHARSRVAQQMAPMTGLLLLWVVLFLTRRVLRGWFKKLVRPMDDSLFQGVSANLEAAALTIVIASMWPLFVWLIGWVLSQMALMDGNSGRLISDAAKDLLTAVGSSLTTTAYVYWLAEIARQVFRTQGLAIGHLGWDPTTAEMVRKAIRRLMMIGLPLVLLVNLTEAVDQGQARDSLGRLVYLTALVALTIFAYREFHPRGQLFESLFHVDAQPARYRRRVGLFWLFLAMMPALAALSISGFHYSAIQLAARLIESLWLFLGVFLVRSLFARWLFIRQWKLARRLAEERAAEEAEAEEETADDGEETEVNPACRAREAKRKEQEQTLVRIDQQLQKLLFLGVSTALLIGLWMIWSGMLPALRALDRVPVWPLGRVVEIHEMPRVDVPAPEPTTPAPYFPTPAVAAPPIIEGTSVADLLVMLLIAFLTIALGKNVPGLLEVTLLERLPIDRGARNAVTTLSGYAIMLAGLLMGANAIGLRWENVQWLAAALTVGLGFGLQEIFANFVSGLILLFERPIRVGDIITLGDIDGTVTKIRIRATTITNWDRKELIVPNKELITGRLLNWTLSDQINRIVVEVGVAYGSNIAKVRRLMLRIANEHPIVLNEPAPSVTFESFGDSALNFVLRCHLPNLENRLATIHDLNATIHDRFRREGIEIAFPQLDLHVRSGLPESSAGGPS